MSSDDGRLEFVDALRGIAALGVVAMHVGRYFPGLPTPVAALAEQGARGVQLFFIVSAFTMFLTLDRRRGRDESVVLGFAARRLCRIAPMYYIAVAYYWLTRNPEPDVGHQLGFICGNWPW